MRFKFKIKNCFNNLNKVLFICDKIVTISFKYRFYFEYTLFQTLNQCIERVKKRFIQFTIVQIIQRKTHKFRTIATKCDDVFNETQVTNYNSFQIMNKV